MVTIHHGTDHTVRIIIMPTGATAPIIMPAAIKKERTTGAAIMIVMPEMIMAIAETGIIAMETVRKIPETVAVDAMAPEVIPRPQ